MTETPMVNRRFSYDFPPVRLVSGICSECKLPFTDLPRGTKAHPGECQKERRRRLDRKNAAKWRQNQKAKAAAK